MYQVRETVPFPGCGCLWGMHRAWYVSTHKTCEFGPLTSGVHPDSKVHTFTALYESHRAVATENRLTHPLPKPTSAVPGPVISNAATMRTLNAGKVGIDGRVQPSKPVPDFWIIVETLDLHAPNTVLDTIKEGHKWSNKGDTYASGLRFVAALEHFFGKKIGPWWQEHQTIALHL